jgi:hypothetical protein
MGNTIVNTRIEIPIANPEIPIAKAKIFEIPFADSYIDEDECKPSAPPIEDMSHCNDMCECEPSAPPFDKNNQDYNLDYNIEYNQDYNQVILKWLESLDTSEYYVSLPRDTFEDLYNLDNLDVLKIKGPMGPPGYST